MRVWQVVLDTSVWIAALRSRRGASFRVLSLLGTGQFEIHLSVPLVLEYEDVARRLIGQTALDESDINDILDYVCSVARHQDVHYLWRPFSPDPNDDMVIELAVAAGCDFIVTHNARHFRGVDRFGMEAITPREFLERIGELS